MKVVYGCVRAVTGVRVGLDGAAAWPLLQRSDMGFEWWNGWMDGWTVGLKGVAMM